MPTINLQPQILDLALYAGDGVEFRLVCTDAEGAPVDITGSVNAQVRLDRLTDVPPIAEFTANLVDAYKGIIVLTLTDDQTRDLLEDPSAHNGKFIGVWDIQWTPASALPRTLVQGKLECVADVTR